MFNSQTHELVMTQTSRLCAFSCPFDRRTTAERQTKGSQCERWEGWESNPSSRYVGIYTVSTQGCDQDNREKQDIIRDKAGKLYKFVFIFKV